MTLGSSLERAMALHRAGQLPQALTAYQHLLSAEPDNADALHLSGVLAHQMGRTSVGIACIEQAIALNPKAPIYHRNMAELRKSTGDHRRAAVHLLQAIALNPDDVGARVELGLMQAACGDLKAAIDSYRAALRHDPDHVGALTNLGVALEDSGDETSARSAYERAIELQPDFTPALNNLGALSGAQEQIDQGIALLRRAVSATPDHAEARVNLGHLLLHTGALTDGWQMLEARRTIADALRPPANVRPWQGPGDSCRRLLVCAEQGLGDELMFLACLESLRAAQPGTTLILECDPRLAPLFSRSFPTDEIRPYRLTADRLRASQRPWLNHAPVDAYVPAGSLPLHFMTDPAAFPETQGYLTPDPARVQHWRQWLASLPDADDRRTVGLCWRSGSVGGARDTLAVPLPAWAPLLRHDKLRIVNLQYGEAGPALVKYAKAIDAPVQTAPELDLFNDLDDLAALVAALDMVVSAATSVCEMGGALGRPTWRVVRGNDWSMLGAQSRRPWHVNTQSISASRSAPAENLVHELITKILAE